jgi:hypothetical protein
MPGGTGWKYWDGRKTGSTMAWGMASILSEIGGLFDVSGKSSKIRLTSLDLLSIYTLMYSDRAIGNPYVSPSKQYWFMFTGAYVLVLAATGEMDKPLIGLPASCYYSSYFHL